LRCEVRGRQLLPGRSGVTGTSEPGMVLFIPRTLLNGPRRGAPSWGFRPPGRPPEFVEPVPAAGWLAIPIGTGGGTGAESRYVCPGGKTGELVLVDGPPMNVNTEGAAGSATVARDTTRFVAPAPEICTVGPPAVSAPDPTWMLKPLPAPLWEAEDEARLESPVMLPGRKLENPPLPVMKKLVGIGNPLTELALPPPPPLLPKEPAPEEFAPGNGVSNVRPLVVSTMSPRFVAMSARSSRTQSFRLGRNIKRSFILNVQAIRARR